ncbi:transposase [Tolypothrix sp. NIES-4075]|nr:transposase [Tolypothrix sp. NIES-4075]GAX45601.1 transposase [Tolypothrix sp. NIES-4075]GAX46034.1 transposase [Tolypothrix sp. NIES-4075]GAX46225.1 transposase [Tolypothrix sp. NIES-4075]GAX46240.1 transposase [Tolypothrix sp. NIES-4075]
MAKKYIVNLSEDEVSQLRTVIKTGKRKARIITRVHILLMANEGKTDKTIAEALRVHVSTVERTREEFVFGGLDLILSDRPHPPKPCKLDGRQEAFLIATACSEPPEGRVRWTMQLLADRLISINMVDSISDETVRQTLKKTKLSRGLKSSGVFQK